MSSFPIPSNENERLKALASYQILDTAPQQAYDDLALIASQICQTPIALISLVDEHRQWFKAKVGTEAEQSSREISICAHAIMQTDLFLIEDASGDPRFAENPWVKNNPRIRFYAGAPLIDGDGYALGSLCVIDQKPRTLTQDQQRALQALGRQVMAQMELQRKLEQMAKILDDYEQQDKQFKQFIQSEVRKASMLETASGHNQPFESAGSR